MNEQKVEVRLYGHLRARFGRGYPLAVKTPAEAVRALCAVVPGFERYVREHDQPGYRVRVGKATLASDDQLHHPSGPDVIRIVPIVAGAARGIGKIIGGAALVAFSFATGGASLGMLGALQSGSLFAVASAAAFSIGTSMILGGAAQMLTRAPSAPSPGERPENQPSYAFNGAVNVTAQGHPVPLCYGRMRVGSVVVSSGLSVAQIAV